MSPDELDRMIAAARTDLPPPEEVASVAVSLGLPTPHRPAPNPPSGPALSLGVKVSLVAVGMAAITAFVWWSLQAPAPPPALESTEARSADQPPDDPPLEQALPLPEVELLVEPVAPIAESDPTSPTGERPRRIPSEMELLSRARRQTRTAPRRALATLRQHARHYGNGVLAEERDVLEIEALGALGSSDAARAAAERFTRRHPSSVHQRRIDRALASDSR